MQAITKDDQTEFWSVLMLPCSVLILLSTFFLNEDTEEPDPTKNNSFLEIGLYQYHNALLYTEHEHKHSLPKLTRENWLLLLPSNQDYFLFIIVAIFKVVLKNLQAQTLLLVDWIFMTNFLICCFEDLST